jgi:hypothetical protein
MKTRFILFRRVGVYYYEDTITGKQSSLRTKIESDAVTLLNAKNESVRQPALNLQIAMAYLAGTDPAFVTRTWQTVMDEIQTHGKLRLQTGATCFRGGLHCGRKMATSRTLLVRKTESSIS